MHLPETHFSGHPPPGTVAAPPALDMAQALNIAIELLDAAIAFIQPYAIQRAALPPLKTSPWQAANRRLGTLQAARRLLAEERRTRRRAALCQSVRRARTGAPGGAHARQ